MNWGGIIAGALGGGAQAASQIADESIRKRDTIEAEQRRGLMEDQRMERRAVLDAARADAAADRALDLAERREKAKAVRYQDDYDKSVKLGDENRLAKNRAALVESMPSASPETVDLVLKNQEAVGMLTQGGQLERRTSGVRLQDYVDAARSVGADPTVRADFRSDQKAAVDAERAQAKDGQTERKLDETERKNEANEKLRDKQITGLIARSGSGGREAKDDLTTAEQRRATDSLSNAETRAAKRFREPTFQEKGNEVAAASYQKLKNEFIDKDRSVMAAVAHLDNVTLALAKRRDDGKPAPGKPAPAVAPEPKRPASIKGAPESHTVGAFVQDKGFEVKDKSGKLIGYVGAFVQDKGFEVKDKSGKLIGHARN